MSAEGLLARRCAIVTGGARGLGAAIARRFRAEGAPVAVLDLPDAFAAGGAPAGEMALICDVTRDADVAAAMADIVRRFGRLDIVVANAGVVPPWRSVDALDIDEWDRVFAVNVRGVALTVKHAAAHMADGGSVVAMGSIMSERGAPGQLLYSATKHAVLGIVRAAAHDLGPRGIRVNALGPGPVATEALRGRMAARAAAGGVSVAEAMAASAQTPLRRMATEEDVARAAVFLASDLSSGVTGRLVPVEAGLLA